MDKKELAIPKWQMEYYKRYAKFLESPEYKRYQRYLMLAKAGRYDLILED